MPVKPRSSAPQNRQKGWWERSISQKTLSSLSIILIVGMLIPLIIIALYNYPGDDDFSFTLPATQAWAQTGSLWEALKAIYTKTLDIYLTWQGNFVSTFFFGLTPMFIDIDLYFISNWIILAIICLATAYCVKSLTRVALNGSRYHFWICYALILMLVLQWMPSMGDSVYWHNGGMYTVAAFTLVALLGLLMRCSGKQTRARSVWRAFCAAALGFMLGGSFFGPMLGAGVFIFLYTMRALFLRSKNRVHSVIALVFFLLSMLISVLAPGNALRQAWVEETVPPVIAVITAILDSLDLAGQWTNLKLIGLMMVMVPLLWKPLKESPYQFKHPLLIFVGLYGLFSATLVPGIYTNFGYGYPRYMNSIYFYYLVMAIGSAFYFEGALIRYLERRQETAPAALLNACRNLGERFTAGYLALCIALVMLGCFGTTIMNTSSISAAKSLITGEAAQFHREMLEREQYIFETDSDVTEIDSLSCKPYVFKEDKLPWQGNYGPVRYMKWTFEAQRANGVQ